MAGRPVLGSIVIVNYITVTTDWKPLSTEVKAKICCLLCQVHSKMPMLPSEETLLMTARILWGSVTAQLQSQPWNQNSLVPAWSLTKEQREYWPMVLIHPLALSKQKLWSLPWPWEHLLLVYSSVISTVGWSCSEGNQFGQHYMWYWNRNVDTDNVFEKVEYFRKVFKYKYFDKSI